MIHLLLYGFFFHNMLICICYNDSVTQQDVLLFEYDKENKTKFTKVRLTEGVTHYKSSHISCL